MAQPMTRQYEKRLSAALYYARKKNRQRRIDASGGTPTPASLQPFSMTVGEFSGLPGYITTTIGAPEQVGSISAEPIAGHVLLAFYENSPAEGNFFIVEGDVMDIMADCTMFVDGIQMITGSAPNYNAETNRTTTTFVHESFRFVDGETYEITWVAPDSLLTDVDGNGFTASWDGTPPSTVLLAPTEVQRAAFVAGSPVVVNEAIVVTKRFRDFYPNQATFTPNKVALSTFLYGTDSRDGIANNSALASPKPTAKWAMPHRKVIGNTLHWELVVFHRNGRRLEYVDCVEVTATDSLGASITSKVSLSTKSTTLTATPVTVSQGNLDVTTLAPGQITLNAKIWPHIGDATSVLDSSASANFDEFSPRYFIKNTGLSAAPRIAYVSTVSGVTTGVISTNDATAAATPWSAVGNALAAAVTAYGSVDGLEIVLKADSTSLGSWGAVNRTHNLAGVIVRKDPTYVGRQPFTFSTSQRTRINAPTSGVPGGGCITFQGLAITRTAGNFDGSTGTGTGAHTYQFEDCSLDGNNVAGTMCVFSFVRFYGCTFSNMTNVALAGSSATVSLFFFGCQGDLTDTATLDNRCIVGCVFDRMPGPQKFSGNSQNNAIQAFNKFRNLTAGSFNLYANPDNSPVSNCAIVQNVYEFLRNTLQPGLAVAADSATFSTYNIMIHNNTIVGLDDKGRFNSFYDETAGTTRTHVLHSVQGNIFCCRAATKGDIFMMDGTRTGNASYSHGVDGGGNLVCDLTSFVHDFDGVGSVVSTGTHIDPLFVDNRGPTSGANGTAGGNYDIQSGSPAKGIVPRSFGRFDMNGNERPMYNSSAGAYQ